MLQNFPGRQPDEKVIMVIRKHPIVYIRSTLVFVMAVILPLIIFLIIWSGTFPLSQGGAVSVIGYLGASFYLLYGMALFVISILNDVFDLFILTNHRLLDITQVTLLSRTVAITPLNQIQDTTSDVRGILGTLLNFGIVNVQTAAGFASNFVIENVPDPSMIARHILNESEKRKEYDSHHRKEKSDSDTDLE